MSGIMSMLLGAVSSAADEFFNRVTLLLNTGSTNGAQNNTFLDSSSNAFSITRNGNTTQGTFTPFSQTGWSNYFNGTNSFLTVPDNNAYSFTGDFCIEAFIYLNALPAESAVFSQWFGGTVAQTAMYFYINSSGRIVFITGVSSTQTTITATSTTVSANQWAHVAVCRSGTTVRLFVNGVADSTTGTVSGTINNIAYTPQIGNLNNQGSSANFLNGYISNLRVTNGALYTSNFTPSTTPLTTTVSAGSVILLTCQSNSFIDNSSNVFTVTLGGTPSVQAFSPFAPTAAYSTTTVGGSGYFDGTGDYLTTTTSSAFDISTTDWTIQTWIYPTAFTTSGNNVLYYVGTSASDKIVIANIQSGGSGLWYLLNGTGVITTTKIPTLNAWSFIALVKSGSTTTLYLNGTSIGTTTSVPTSSNKSVNIGSDAGAAVFQGYFSDFRILKGTANTSVPTAPLTAITNTSLLINYTNAGIFDAAAKNDLETVGNAQVSTTQAKWGTTSMYFDGDTDYVGFLKNENVNLGSGDFTIEFWAYWNAFGTDKKYCISITNGTNYWQFNHDSSSGVGFNFNNGTTQTVVINQGSNSGWSTGTWYHVALVRSGTTLTVYRNGVSLATGTLSGSLTNQTTFCIGGAIGFTSTTMNGYIDDFRITKGYARYTTTFTPATASFPTQ